MKNYIGIGCYKPESEFVLFMKDLMLKMIGETFPIASELLTSKPKSRASTQHCDLFDSLAYAMRDFSI